ncbi:hypothetical protein BpHYR1_031931 [Brachionus plicatilis]|uniref:Uncharacterized protein n=1 Tax=Brachionus plicatilis TaxID=10195 RepID=A0A3M7QUY8_BRAPC|nr:hypothetical protein BpHYR1_031931 [Brachionus plicatilis]
MTCQVLRKASYSRNGQNFQYKEINSKCSKCPKLVFQTTFVSPTAEGAILQTSAVGEIKVALLWKTSFGHLKQNF